MTAALRGDRNQIGDGNGYRTSETGATESGYQGYLQTRTPDVASGTIRNVERVRWLELLSQQPDYSRMVDRRKVEGNRIAGW